MPANYSFYLDSIHNTNYLKDKSNYNSNSNNSSKEKILKKDNSIDYSIPYNKYTAYNIYDAYNDYNGQRKYNNINNAYNNTSDIIPNKSFEKVDVDNKNKMSNVSADLKIGTGINENEFESNKLLNKNRLLQTQNEEIVNNIKNE